MPSLVIDPETGTIRRPTFREIARHTATCRRCRRRFLTAAAAALIGAVAWLGVLNLIADVDITTRLVVAILVAEIVYGFVSSGIRFVGAAVAEARR